MEGVMKFLGHLEKWLTTLYDIPASVHPKLLHQRHHAAQNLSYPPAGKGGVDILNNLPR